MSDECVACIYMLYFIVKYLVIYKVVCIVTNKQVIWRIVVYWGVMQLTGLADAMF